MIRILVVVPYEELNEQVREYMQSVDCRDFIVDIEHFIGTESQVIKRCDADIVVARGITGRALARENPNVHLVEISISGSDLISALWKCRGGYGEKGVGIVLADAGICDPVQLKDLTGIPIHLRKAENESELNIAIAELAGLGIETFIGGLTLCRRCDDQGYNYIHIKSGNEAIARALNEAMAAARSLNRERTRANLVATVLNNAEDVMFAVSKEGIVIAANMQASTLFLGDGSMKLEGQRIAGLFPGDEWEQALETQLGSEILRPIDGQLMLVKTTPITVGTESFGVLVTCRNVEALRETERKIRKELSKKGLVAHYHFGNILHRSDVMNSLIIKATKYSRVDSNVFIIGETGTGKELFAQSIHAASKRSSNPFVAVNCAALPENLLESELFGYTEGAFSGAVKGGRMGLFELAHTGTIFLDEIGEMPLSLQAKILRVLQEREIRKIGGDAVVPVDVRIISATNIDILERVHDGSFREDLYYRINLLNLRIPPLRERSEDVDLLFRHFVNKYATALGKPVPRIEPGIEGILRANPWMGNIRELRNFCERLVILNDSGCIDRTEVEASIIMDDRLRTSTRLAGGEPDTAMRERHAGSLVARLNRSGLDRNGFAESLGMSRTTLWRKLKAECHETLET